MPSLGDMFVTIGVKMDNFLAAMGDVNDTLKRTAREAKAASAGWSEAFGSMQRIGLGMTAAVTLPILGGGLAAVKVSEQLNMARISFETMLGSAERAGAFLAQLKTFAVTTPFEFPELVSAAKRMMALGFSADQVIPTLRTIGDAVAALGGGAEVVNRVTLALGQMQAKGKVSAQEMNQLAENGIPAWDTLSKKIGVSIPEAMELAKDGAISASIAVPAILEGMNDKFSGNMEKASKTLTGVWSNFKDQATFVLGDIGNTLAPVLKELVTDVAMPLLNVVKGLTGAFAALDPSTQKIIIGFTALVAAAGPLLLAVGTMGLAFNTARSAILLMGPVFAPLITLIGGVAAALGTLVVSTIPAFVASVGTMSLALLGSAARAFTTLAVTSIPQMAAALLTASTAFLTLASTGIAAAAASIASFVTSTIPAMTTALLTLARTGIAAASAGLVSMATVALPYIVGAVAIAAAAFAAWKLFEWAKDLPIVRTAIESVGNVINWLVEQLKKIPGVTFVIDGLKTAASGLSGTFSGLTGTVTDLTDSYFKFNKEIQETDLASQFEKAAEASKKAAEQMKKDFSSLGLPEQKLDEMRAAYERLLKSGKLSSDQLVTAQENIASAIAKTNEAVNKSRERWVAAYTSIITKAKEAKKAFDAFWDPSEMSLFHSSMEKALDIRGIEEFSGSLKTMNRIIMDLQFSTEQGFFRDSLKRDIAATDELNRDLETLRIKHVESSENIIAANTRVQNNAMATSRQRLQAELAALKEREREANESGERISTADKKRISELEIALTGSSALQKKALQEISTIITDMGRSIADAIIHWKGFGDVVKNTLEAIGTAILRHIIQNILESTNVVKKLSEELIGVLGKIPGLAGIFGSVAKPVAGKVGDIVGGVEAGLPGGALATIGGVGGSAAEAAGGVASAGGGAASAASTAASTSLSSVLGLVTGAVSAVSGIIGNFQSMGMNKSLDIIVLHTLQTANDLANLRADEWARETHLMVKLDDLHNRAATALGEWRNQLTFQLGDWRQYLELQMDQVIQNTAQLTPATAVAGGGGTVINNNINGGTYMSDRAIDELLDLLVNRLKQRNA